MRVWTRFQTQTQQEGATGRQPQQEPCSVPKRNRHRPDPTPSQPPRLGETSRMDLTLSHNTASTQGKEKQAHRKTPGLGGHGTPERVRTATPGFPRARPRPGRVCRRVAGTARSEDPRPTQPLPWEPHLSQSTYFASLSWFLLFSFLCVLLLLGYVLSCNY